MHVQGPHSCPVCYYYSIVQETCWFTHHISCKTGEGKTPGTEKATSVAMTMTMFPISQTA